VQRVRAASASGVGVDRAAQIVQAAAGTGLKMLDLAAVELVHQVEAAAVVDVRERRQHKVGVPAALLVLGRDGGVGVNRDSLALAPGLWAGACVLGCTRYCHYQCCMVPGTLAKHTLRDIVCGRNLGECNNGGISCQ